MKNFVETFFPKTIDLFFIIWYTYNVRGDSMKKEIREMIEELCVCDYFTLDEKIKLLKIYQKLLTK